MASNRKLLRWNQKRSAQAGRLLVRRRSLVALFLVLLALAAGLLVVSQLAKLHDEKAPARAGFLSKALGAPQALPPRARRSPTIVARLDQGLSVEATDGVRIALRSADTGAAAWAHHANGASRRTPFGSETIVLGTYPEQFLTVEKRQGTRTWTWPLGTSLKPRLLDDGGVGFFDPKSHRVSVLSIAPVAIFDRDGDDITPAGLRWGLLGPNLKLTLSDEDLPLPYVIDPAFRSSANTSNTTAATSSSLTMPTGVAQNDVMIAEVQVGATTATLTVNPPDTSWRLIRHTRNGTAISLFTFYKVAGASEAGPYVFTIEDPAGTAASKVSNGGIAAYTDVFTAAPVEASFEGTGATRYPNLTGISTQATNRLLVYALGTNGNRGLSAPPTIDGTTMTRRYTNTATPGGGLADKVQTAKLTSASTTLADAGGAVSYAAQMIVLVPTSAPPVFSDKTFTANSASATSISLTRPAGVAADNVMVAEMHIGATTATLTVVPPAGWTLIRHTRNSTAISLFTFYKTAGTAAADPGPYVFAFEDAGTAASKVSNGGITAYSGIDLTAPVDASFEAVGTGTRNPNITGISTSGTNRTMVFVASNTGTRDLTIAPTLDGTTMTRRYTNALTPGGGLADKFQAAQLTSASTTLAEFGGNVTWAAQMIALAPDATAPTQTLSVAEGTNPGGQYFNTASRTHFYNPTAGAGDFTITSVPSDVGSGVGWVSFADIFSSVTFTHTAKTVGSPGPYTSNTYAWTAANATAPSGSQVTVFDNGGNSTSGLTFVRDATSPTAVTLLAPAGGARIRNGATVSVAGGSPTDAGAGMAQLEFRACPGSDGCAFADIDAIVLGTDSSDPYSAAWPAGRTDGPFQIIARATDRVGNVTDSASPVNVELDNTPPAFASSATSVDGTQLTLTYAEALDGSFTPAGSSYLVEVNSVNQLAPTVAVSGSTVTLTLAARVFGADTVKVAYAVPDSNQLRDLAGNNAAALALTTATNNSVAPDGSGTNTVSPTSVVAASTGRTLTFTYTETVAGGMNSGAVEITVPANWSAPSTISSEKGYTTSSTGTVGVAGQVITVTGVTLAQGATLTVTYGAGPGADAPSAGQSGSAPWTTKQRSTAGGTLSPIASPSVNVTNAANGTGTLTTPTTNTTASSTNNTVVFTYTAATGGLNSGSVTVAVPSGWTAPNTSSGTPGYTVASAGTVGTFGQTITVSALTLDAGQTFTITYGSGGGGGATATSSTGAQTWQAQQKAASGGTLANLFASPSITVLAADGFGTLTTPTTTANASSTGNTIVFTYTAATGGMSNGGVRITVPTGWSAPSTTGADSGFTTSSTGTVGVSGQDVIVSGVTLAGGATMTITYGATGGGSGATAPVSAGSQTWQGAQRSQASGTFINLFASPSIAVTDDGAGTLTTPTSSVGNASTGNTLVFTYTAAAGGMTSGALRVTVPAGWSAPSITGSANGFSTANVGTLSVSGQDINVDGVTLAGGGTVTITYGATSGAGSGATVTGTAGAQTWQAQQKASSGGTLTNLEASPSITVLAADGSGTLTTPTTGVSNGATGQTLVFTYTAAAGGLDNGAVRLTVPTGWSAPSTTGAAAGFTAASTGTVGASGQQITVTGVTLAGAATMTLTYGATSDSGSGATAPTGGGAQTWQAQERSSTGGTLKNLDASPSITVFAADSSGTLTTPTTEVVNGSAGNTVVFTYTVAAGGMNDGAVRLTIPTGWSAPSTTNSAAGYVTAGAGTVGIAGQVVTVTGVTLASGATLTVTYGAAPGPATAPTTGGNQSWAGAQRATTGGSITGLDASPSILVTSKPDVPSHVTPADAAWVLTTTPTLTASFNDADVFNTGQITFRVCADSGCGTVLGSNFSSIAGLANPFNGSAAVPGAAGLVSGTTYYWQARAEDSTGLQSAFSASRSFTVDSLPATQTLSVTSVSQSGGIDSAVKSGALVYFRGSVAGSFKVSSAVTDGGSGPASAQYAALGGTTTGWTFSPGTVSTPAGGPYESATFSWSAGTTANPTEQVTARDVAGNTTAATLTFTNDSTAPSGAITAPGALQFVGGAAVTVTSDSADTGGSGTRSAQFFYCPGAACDPFAATSIATDSNAAGGWSVSWNASALADGTYQLGVRTTDNVGNTFDSGARQVRVDNSAPTQVLTVTGTGVIKSGDTVFYRGSKTGGGNFTVTSTVSDGTGSGAQSTTFAPLGGTTTGWTFTGTTDSTPAGGPFESNSLTWPQNSTSAPTLNVTSTDLAGNVTSPATTLTLTNDSTAPIGEITAPAASAALRGTTVSVTADSADTASGVASVLFQYFDGATWNDIGVADTVFPYAVTWDTTASGGDGAKQLRAVTTDKVGNVYTSLARNVTVDNTAPTQSVALSGISQSGGNDTAFRSGTTIFYRGPVAGSFTLTNTVTDPTSGPGSSTSALGGDTTGWTHSAGSVSTPAGGPYVSASYGWGAGTTSAATATVTGADAAGNPVATSDTFTLTNDSTAPTGNLTMPAANAFLRSSITVSSDSADGGAGVKSALFEVKPAAGSFVTLCNDTTPGDGYGCSWNTTLVTDGAFVLRVTTTDNVGNTFAHQIDVTVDNSAPTQTLSITGVSPAGSALKDGSTVWYRGSAGGSLNVQSAVADVNPASATFAALGGTTAGWSSVAALPATVTAPAGGPFASPTLTWGAGTTSAPTVTVTGADKSANETAPATLTFANDSTAPSTAIACDPSPCKGATGTYVISPVQLTLTPTDSGAGVLTTRYTTDGTNPTAGSGTVYTGPISISTQGTTTVKYASFDKVGNAEAVLSEVVKIDSSNPTLASAARATGGDAVVLTYSEPLIEASTPAGASFQVKVSGIARVTSAVSISGARVTVSFDGAPALATEPITIAYTVDPINPLQDLAGNDAAGFPAQALGTSGSSTSSTPPPASTPPPVGPSPEIAITSRPAATTSDRSASFSFSSETGARFTCQLDGGEHAACSSPTTYTGLNEGSHSFEVRGTALNGRQMGSRSASWTIDLSGPAITSVTGPSDPSQESSATFSFAANEPGALFECRLDSDTFASCSAGPSYSGLAAGPHTFGVRGVDSLGNRGAWVTYGWTINTASAQVTTPEAGSISEPKSGVTVSWPASAVGSGGLELTMDSIAPSNFSFAGFVVDGAVIEITAETIAGASVTQFPDALDLHFGQVAANVVPATAERGGAWRILQPVSSHALPADRADGFFRDATGLHILTRHLSMWAMVRDVEAPAAPAGLAGTVEAGQAVLRWTPGADNSGYAAGFVLHLDGQPANQIAGPDRELRLPFDTADARKYTLTQLDSAGNTSPQSAALRVRPDLTGKSLDEARALLAARGFQLGAVTEAPATAPTGTVITPAGPGFAAEGTSVDLVLAAVSSQSRFVLNVAGPARFKRLSETRISARLVVTRAARVTAVLRGPGGERVYTWRTSVRAGATILRFRVPTVVQRPGRYTIRWIASATNGQVARKTTSFVLVGPSPGPSVKTPAEPVDVVLTSGNSALQAGLALGLGEEASKLLVVKSDQAFDTAGASRHNVGVVVVDIDENTLSFLHDLSLVFPNVKIVAVGRDPERLKRAVPAGATVALPSSTSPKQLAAVVRRLASASSR